MSLPGLPRGLGLGGRKEKGRRTSVAFLSVPVPERARWDLYRDFSTPEVNPGASRRPRVHTVDPVEPALGPWSSVGETWSRRDLGNHPSVGDTATGRLWSRRNDLPTASSGVGAETGREALGLRKSLRSLGGPRPGHTAGGPHGREERVKRRTRRGGKSDESTGKEVL